MLPGRDATSVRSGLGEEAGFSGVKRIGSELERWCAAGDYRDTIYTALFLALSHGFFSPRSASEVRQAKGFGFSGPMLHVVSRVSFAYFSYSE